MTQRSVAGVPIRSIDVLGVRVDDVRLGEAIEICRACVRSGATHHVVTPNAEFVMRAQRDRDFCELLNGATLSIPDGAGLLMAGRLLGTPLREQVAGTDLAAEWAALAGREGFRLFLLGGQAGLADAAARELERRHAGLAIAGTFAGSREPFGDADARAAIRQAGRVDMLLVGYGAPHQERWIARNQAVLEIPLAMGIGGAYEFLAGRVRRAPRLVRRAGFDWAFRLTMQPWRWRRQLALPRFLVAVAVEAARRRAAGASRGES